MILNLKINFIHSIFLYYTGIQVPIGKNVLEYKYHPIISASGSKEIRENFNLCPKSLEKTLYEMKKRNTMKTSLDTNILED